MLILIIQTSTQQMIQDITEILSQYPHLVLWAATPLVLVLSLIYRKNSFDLKFNYTNYLINYFFLGMVIILSLMVMGLAYLVLLSSGALLVPSLVVFHILSTLGGITGIVYFFTIAGTPNTLEVLKQKSEDQYFQKVAGIRSGLILFVLIFLSGQLMFMINMIIGIIGSYS